MVVLRDELEVDIAVDKASELCTCPVTAKSLACELGPLAGLAEVSTTSVPSLGVDLSGPGKREKHAVKRKARF